MTKDDDGRRGDEVQDTLSDVQVRLWQSLSQASPDQHEIQHYLDRADTFIEQSGDYCTHHVDVLHIVPAAGRNSPHLCWLSAASPLGSRSGVDTWLLQNPLSSAVGPSSPSFRLLTDFHAPSDTTVSTEKSLGVAKRSTSNRLYARKSTGGGSRRKSESVTRPLHAFRRLLDDMSKYTQHSSASAERNVGKGSRVAQSEGKDVGSSPRPTRVQLMKGRPRPTGSSDEEDEEMPIKVVTSRARKRTALPTALNSPAEAAAKSSKRVEYGTKAAPALRVGRILEERKGLRDPSAPPIEDVAQPKRLKARKLHKPLVPYPLVLHKAAAANNAETGRNTPDAATTVGAATGRANSSSREAPTEVIEDFTEISLRIIVDSSDGPEQQAVQDEVEDIDTSMQDAGGNFLQTFTGAGRATDIGVQPAMTMEDTMILDSEAPSPATPAPPTVTVGYSSPIGNANEAAGEPSFTPLLPQDISQAFALPASRRTTSARPISSSSPSFHFKQVSPDAGDSGTPTIRSGPLHSTGLGRSSGAISSATILRRSGHPASVPQATVSLPSISVPASEAAIPQARASRTDADTTGMATHLLPTAAQRRSSRTPSEVSREASRTDRLDGSSMSSGRPLALARKVKSAVNLSTASKPSTAPLHAASVNEQPSPAATARIPLASFLQLAFKAATLTSVDLSRPTLPSVPVYRAHSQPVPSCPFTHLFVKQEALTSGGLFGDGYMGSGRRGWWVLPFTTEPLEREGVVSDGRVLGLTPDGDCEDVPNEETDGKARPVRWTLARLRLLIKQIKQASQTRKWGFLDIYLSAFELPMSRPSGSGDLGTFRKRRIPHLRIACQSSMALMLRSMLGAWACKISSTGEELEELDDATSLEVTSLESMPGDRWLSHESGIRLVWVDEMDRREILAS